ncbi:MAG: gliding motility lipoprotein GldH [Bacteroidales bacterium]|nr:gliding motility lipoprotein GldH [Bacteroidales bacterium]
MRNTGIFLITAIAFCLVSCKHRAVFEKNVAFNDFSWNYNDTMVFNANIDDTTRPHDIYLNIRTSSEYPYSNIYLFITTYAPNGNQLKDTFGIQLADESGRWYGKGAGSIYSLQVPYKKNIKFPFRGIYTFNLQHGMWDQNLEGVTDIGIRVEALK